MGLPSESLVLNPLDRLRVVLDISDECFEAFSFCASFNVCVCEAKHGRTTHFIGGASLASQSKLRM